MVDNFYATILSLSFFSKSESGTHVKKEDPDVKAEKMEEEEEAKLKKEPLSLEELLAKKKAEEAARSKVCALFDFH